MHRSMLDRALAGRGALWHLLVLQLMHCEDEPVHPVFADEAAVEAKRWRLYAGSLGRMDALYGECVM